VIALLQAAVLGIIQGLTEFLPISSSGHLILARALLGWEMLADTHLNKVFDVALHAGTFFALVVYFWTDLLRLISAFATTLLHGLAGDPDRRMACLIVIGTIPGALAGVQFQKVIENTLGRPLLVAGQLIVFALLLYAADRWSRKARAMAEASWWDGILVGLAQAVALAPGVSRSGITITTGLALGMRREAAARFSFLLSVPIVGGTAAYSFFRLVGTHGSAPLPPGAVGMFLVGMIAAAVSGYLCIKYFLGYLQRKSLTPFVLYRIGFGGLLIGYFALAR